MAIERQRILAGGKVFRPGDDMLKTMFEVQGKFHSRINPAFGVLNQVTGEMLLKMTAQAIMMEGAELLDELNWKPWKKTKKEVEWKQVRYEIADIMAFLMNACIEAGMTHEDLFNYYMRKAQVNVERQYKGY